MITLEMTSAATTASCGAIMKRVRNFPEFSEKFRWKKQELNPNQHDQIYAIDAEMRMYPNSKADSQYVTTTNSESSVNYVDVDNNSVDNISSVNLILVDISGCTDTWLCCTLDCRRRQLYHIYIIYLSTKWLSTLLRCTDRGEMFIVGQMYMTMRRDVFGLPMIFMSHFFPYPLGAQSQAAGEHLQRVIFNVECRHVQIMFICFNFCEIYW